MENNVISPREKKQALRDRIEAIRPKLPKNYRGIIIAKYPQYDTYQGSFLISNVISGRSTDEELTEILEKIATSI